MTKHIESLSSQEILFNFEGVLKVVNEFWRVLRSLNRDQVWKSRKETSTRIKPSWWILERLELVGNKLKE